mmetsp:Transcript_36428/g.86520  ORF Transcript_36428/g.86520 Transcript_36428/m.86520 type:complete len:597 (+) Transcript_36428:1320-3110(+)
MGQRRRLRGRVAAQEGLDLERPLLEVGVARGRGGAQERLSVAGEARPGLAAELPEGRQEVAPRRVADGLLVEHPEELGDGGGGAVRGVVPAVLAEDPEDHLEEDVAELRKLEEVEEGQHSIAAEAGIRLIAVVTRALRDDAHDVVAERRVDAVTPHLEHAVHHLYEPVVVRGVALGELGDAGARLRFAVGVSRGAEVVEHTLHDDLDVVRLRHLVQELQCLPLEGLVRILETVDHHHLLLLDVLRVDCHHRGEAVHADVFEVVGRAPQEGGDHLSRGLQQDGVWIDRRDRPDGLVHDSVADGVPRVGSPHDVRQDGVDVLACRLVPLPELREDLEQLDLDKGGRRLVVVVSLREPVLSDLLEDADKARDEVLVRARRLPDDFVQSAEGCAHDGRVVVAEHLPQGLVELFAERRTDLQEAVQDHDRLLLHELLRVAESLEHERHEARDGVVVDQLAEGVQRRAHDEVVVVLEVLHDRVDEHDDVLRFLIQEERRGEIADLLEDPVLVAAGVDDVYVCKAGIVPEHLNVDKPEQILPHLGFVQVRAPEDRLERADLLGHDPVLLLLRSTLANRLDEVSKFTAVTHSAASCPLHSAGSH